MHPPGPPRSGRPFAVACLLLVALPWATGCNTIRDFLIPPETNAAQATRRAMARYASLIVDGAQVAGKSQAIALRNGTIAAIGPLADMRSYRGPATRVVDGRGGLATAGLIDGHVRLAAAAMLRDGVDLSGVADLPTLRRRLAAGSDLLRGDDWAWGWGMQPALLARLTADDLANLAPGLPILLSAGEGRQVLLSRTLLSALPPRLRKTAEAGHGRLNRQLARQVWRVLPGPRPGRLKPLLVQTLSRLRDRGVTTIHVMGATVAIWRILVDLERDRRLDVRCLIYLDALHPDTAKALATRQQQRKPAPGRRRPATTVWQPRRVSLAGLELWLDSPNSGADATLASWLARADLVDLQLAVHLVDAGAAAGLAKLVGAAKRPPGAAPVRVEGPGDVQSVAPICGPRIIASVQPPAAARPWPALALARSCTLIMGSALPDMAARPWRTFIRLTAGTQPAMGAAAAMKRLTTDHRGRVLQLRPHAIGDLVLWDRAWIPGGPTPLPTLVIVDGVIVRDARNHTAAVVDDGDTPGGAISP